MDWSTLAENMVREQLLPRGIRDPRVLEAMRKVPRHLFCPEAPLEMAYADHPLPIGDGQTISQPYMVAAMTELLALQPGDRVLEIGTGSGYQAAVLAELGAEVQTVERHRSLAEKADTRIAAAGYRVQVCVGDGTLGWPDEAPYRGILVTAAAPRIPRPLIKQLALGGRLVLPLGERWMQVLTVLVRDEEAEEGFRRESHFGCVFVPLIGEWGYPA